MQKRILFIVLLLLYSLTGVTQNLFPKGMKVGKVVSGTGIITVDSITQQSTRIIKFWKGATSMIPDTTDVTFLSRQRAANTYQTKLGFTPYNATNPAGYNTGTVTSITKGLGVAAGTITTTGSVAVDTASTVILSRQRAVNMYTPKSHIGTGGNAHLDATQSVSGFMPYTDKIKLDGSAANAINLTQAKDSFVLKRDSVNIAQVVPMLKDSTVKYATPTQLNAMRNSDWLQVLQNAGSTVKAVPIFFSLNSAYNTLTLTSGLAIWIMVDVKIPTTFTGIEFMSGGTAGNFTGNNENKVALYKLNGTTRNKVAESANDATIWKSATSVMKQVPFTATYTASPGIYYIAFVFSASGTPTAAPTLWAQSPMCDDLVGALCGNNKLCFYVASTTALPASQANSVGSVYGACPYLFLY